MAIFLYLFDPRAKLGGSFPRPQKIPFVNSGGALHAITLEGQNEEVIHVLGNGSQVRAELCADGSEVIRRYNSIIEDNSVLLHFLDVTKNGELPQTSGEIKICKKVDAKYRNSNVLKHINCLLRLSAGASIFIETPEHTYWLTWTGSKWLTETPEDYIDRKAAERELLGENTIL